MISVHCGSYICHSCILSEAAKLKELDRNWSEMVVHAITEELIKAGIDLPKTHGEGLDPDQFAMIIQLILIDGGHLISTGPENKKKLATLSGHTQDWSADKGEENLEQAAKYAEEDRTDESFLDEEVDLTLSKQ